MNEPNGHGINLLSISFVGPSSPGLELAPEDRWPFKPEPSKSINQFTGGVVQKGGH